MNRAYFLRSPRLGFSRWAPPDLPLAQSLWGDEAVARYLCAAGRFTPRDIAARLEQELENHRKYGVQYWPVFRLENGMFAGCWRNWALCVRGRSSMPPPGCCIRLTGCA